MTAADLTSRPERGALARLIALLARRNELALILALLVIIVFFGIASPYFFTVRNLTNVLGQASLAMIAGIGAGVFKGYEDARKLAPVFTAVTEPNPEASALYQPHYRRFVDAYPRLRGWF